ncbi:hypothetical protein VTK73DRAFT_10195 [Phialemonium thermophilum]|uniref:Uncharacterized protein n=1 Tax=Phialemonium thermophilum TaxID=223376 RepID=A0ABR3XH95_9PEZI
MTTHGNLNLAPRYQDCGSGFQWYICKAHGQTYTGCCSVDPCSLPDFCPLDKREPGDTSTTAPVSKGTTGTVPFPTTRTLQTSSTTTVSTFPSTLTTESGGFTNSATSFPAVTVGSSTSPSADTQSHPRKSTSFPTAAVVGVVVGLLLLLSAAAFIWYACSRRRRVNKGGRQGLRNKNSLDGPENGKPDPEKVAMSSPNEPMSHYPLIQRTSPSHVFDEFGGRHCTPDSPIIDDNDEHQAYRYSNMSSVRGSTLISPKVQSDTSSDMPSSHHELDSSPVQPPPSTRPGTTNRPEQVAELESPMNCTFGHRLSSQSSPGSSPNLSGQGSEHNMSPQSSMQASVGQPRATLSATVDERISRTYVNSWTKFQNVQI